MATETKLYRLLTQLTDESFSVSKPDTYNLYITLSNLTIRFGVEDIVRNKFVLLEDYSLTNIFTPPQLAQQLNNLISEHAFFSWVKWHLVRISVKNQKFTLLPGTLYEANAAGDYLRLHAEVDDFHDQVLSYHHDSIDIVNIFATDKYLVSALTSLFAQEKIQVCHQTSGLIEAMLHYSERTQQKKMYLFAEPNYLTLILIRDGNLEFCNVFYYVTPEDFIYFVIFVMQEHKLNPDQDPLVVWGDLLHDSDLFDILRKYVRHVRLGQKPTAITYSYKFEDQFGHRYLDIYSLHFCE